MPDFRESETEQLIRSSVRDRVSNFKEEYWRGVRNGEHDAQEFWDEFSKSGFLGTTIPEQYGGEGLGYQELCIVIEELGINGAWPVIETFIIPIVFGGETLLKHGTSEQKETWLPKICNGNASWALGITEPDAGLNTPNIDTFAEQNGDEFKINGRKIYISGVDRADKITLLARTTRKEEVANPSSGLTIFLIDPEEGGIEYSEIPIDIYYPEPIYNVYFDDVKVSSNAIIGEKDKGLYHIFDTLNTERIAGAASSYGMGTWALNQASEFAQEREVFGAPIGSHQAIQHPLADAYAELETARLMTNKAAWKYDNDMDGVGTEANIAHLQIRKAAWHACDVALNTFGGMGFTSDLGIAKLWSRVRHSRIAPLTEQMKRNYIAERELGLPRSY